MTEETTIVALSKIKDNLKGSDESIDDLSSSLNENGLIHPITIDYDYNIISGKRRYLAAKKLGWDKILCVQRIVEDKAVFRLHENLRRRNLSWYEQAELISELHELRQDQKGKKVKGHTSDGWGVEDTAKELGLAVGPTSEYIHLAQAVKGSPELRNIKDKRTAVRISRQVAKRIRQEEEGSYIPEDVEYNQILCGEGSLILKNFPKSCFHTCITDPPWLKFGKAERENLVRNKDTFPVFKQIYRVLNDNSFLYLFCGLDDFLDYSNFLPTLGFKVNPIPLIWHKQKFLSRSGVPAWGYHRDYEFILQAVKGSPALMETIRTAVFREDIVPSVKLIHQNEKPVKLIKTLLAHCTTPGSLVLDPFAGSCVLAEAAYTTGRRYVCVEMDGRAAEKGQDRIKKIKEKK